MMKSMNVLDNFFTENRHTAYKLWCFMTYRSHIVMRLN